MKQVFLSDLASPLEAIDALRKAHVALKIAAERENNLRAFTISDLMIITLNQAEDMYVRKHSTDKNVVYWFNCEPVFWLPEDSDSIHEILKHRHIYVHNPAFA